MLFFYFLFFWNCVFFIPFYIWKIIDFSISFTLPTFSTFSITFLLKINYFIDRIYIYLKLFQSIFCILIITMLLKIVQAEDNENIQFVALEKKLAFVTI